MRIDVQARILEEQFQHLHPALWEVSYLHWVQITPESLPDVVLVGDRVSCKLMKLRLSQKGIYPIDEVLLDGENYQNDFPVNVTYLMTLQDFPGEINNYIRIREKLISYNINKVSVIHDFSSSFALGAEKQIVEKNNIRYAYEILNEIDSKRRFLYFLSQINKPYHWNMDMRADNFGIPDPKQYRPKDEWVDTIPIPSVKEAGKLLFIYCSNKEWNDNDPYLNWSQLYLTSMFFLPDRVYRMKFIEYIKKNKLNAEHLFISRKMLHHSCGQLGYPKRTFSGGTPLLYQTQEVIVEGISLDTVNALTKIGMIVLAVDDAFEDIISGARKRIFFDKPTIIIQGFSQADQLWNSICKIHNLLPDYTISLYRYATENIIQGYSLFLKWKEHRNDKANT